MPKPTASSITVTVSTSANLKIDDVLVYPDNATVKTYSFTKSVGTRGDTRGYQLTAETGMNGTTRYYVYTNNTMPYLVKDAEENIVQVNKQRTVGQDWEINLLQFTYDNPITWEAPVTHGVTVNIYANVLGPTPCEAGISYTWSFGDGSSNVTTTDPSVQHTYSTAGKYQVTCTMSASGYTSVSASSPATSSVNALTVN
jgi:PKD repeat protein